MNSGLRKKFCQRRVPLGDLVDLVEKQNREGTEGFLKSLTIKNKSFNNIELHKNPPSGSVCRYIAYINIHK